MMLFLSAGDMVGANRLPPGAAAEICAATPMLMDASGFVLGPLVGLLHFGLEHKKFTLSAKSLFVFRGKSSLLRTFHFPCTWSIAVSY
jgi:hypothetical protein